MNAPVIRSCLAAIDDRLWYKDAVIYQLHVKSYFDANNDGIGDFAGLMSKLDYIAALGVNTIWLLPFYPSPRLDDGYDISEYKGVHSDYGTMRDVRRFISAAHKRGLHVITELVINHTSDQHPWFQRARKAKPGSVYRNFYVWSDTDTKYAGTRVIFIDTERSNWTWDDVAGAYYWHRFYSHQPELNFDNPHVIASVLGVMRYWLDLGVDGLRLDAVPYLAEREGTNNENLPETHAILKRFRAELDAQYPGRVFLAEANQWPEDTKEYFGDGDECHMAFHFPLMPRMYMAVAREDRFPITDILRQTPEIPSNCQWAIFLRNHDELTLEMVTDAERDYLWSSYAADRRARLNLGIRRRLAPLLERDRRRMELMSGLLLSMPGTPVIYYGDEIGMGDNIFLGDRDGVRTPMQWSSDRNGGFSQADPGGLVLPPIMDPLYGFGAINVEAQNRDPHSLLNWTRRMLAVRRKYQVFGRGKLTFLYPKNRKILAYLRELDGVTVLCVANVSRAPQAVELDLSPFEGRVPIELTGGTPFPPIGQLTYLLTLAPYGFYWFLLATEADWPSWHTPAPEPMPEYQTLVIRDGLPAVLDKSARAQFERDILPPYLAKRRWFSGKDRAIQAARLRSSMALPSSSNEVVLAEVEVEADRDVSCWFLPLSIAWDDASVTPLASQLALARVRKGRRVGFLTDAFSSPEFARQLVSNLASGTRLDIAGTTVLFEPTEKLRGMSLEPDIKIDWIAAEQSNSSLILGDVAVVKIFRKLSEGIHPEAELGRHLTAQDFDHIPQLLGEVIRRDADGSQASLAVVQSFIRNQGDGWTWTLDHLNRAIGDRGAQDKHAMSEQEYVATYEAFVTNIARRLGEMHEVLKRPSTDSAFTPRSATKDDASLWCDRVGRQLDAAFKVIESTGNWDRDAGAENTSAILAMRPQLLAALPRLARAGIGEILTRIHGDFHLGQVLVSSGDAFIIDFEGQPGQPLDVRRRKTSPLQDVAGFLRSIDYASAVIKRKNVASHAVAAGGDHDELLHRFSSTASAAFLDAYAAAVGELGAERKGLLNFFVLEKAAYEICYEAANRPAWVNVPLSGLAAVGRRILERAAE